MIDFYINGNISLELDKSKKLEIEGTLSVIFFM